MAGRRNGLRTGLRAVALLLLGMAASPATLSSEQGRARVTADLLILEAPEALRGQAETLAEGARSILPRLQSELGASLAAPFVLYLIPGGTLDDPELAQLDERAPPWASGFLLPDQRVGALRVEEASRYPHGDLLSVLAHETVHMILHDAAGHRLPRWFEEGAATRLGRRWGLRDMVVYSSWVVRGKPPTLERINEGFHKSGPGARLAYAASFDFITWSENRHGDDLIRRVLAETAVRPFAGAWLVATGAPLGADEAEWRRSSLTRYRWIPIITASTTLWIVITVLFLMSLFRRRARSRAILERWEREETTGVGA